MSNINNQLSQPLQNQEESIQGTEGGSRYAYCRDSEMLQQFQA